MYDRYRISVIIPCYNEAEGLRQLLPLLPSCVDELIVVDNGSTDQTVMVAERSGALVVREARRGVGYAYQRGFRQATGDVLFCLDGDATYPIQEIPSLVAHAVEHSLDFVSCCRFPLTQPSAMSLRNRIGNRVLTAITNCLFGLSLQDVMSGMWVIRRAALAQVSFQAGGMASTVEVKLRAFLAPSVKASERPIPFSSRVGVSKLVPWRDGWECLTLMGRWKICGPSTPPPKWGRKWGRFLRGQFSSHQSTS